MNRVRFISIGEKHIINLSLVERIEIIDRHKGAVRAVRIVFASGALQIYGAEAQQLVDVL